MTAFTAQQWGDAGEHALRHYCAVDGVVPSDALLLEARACAQAIACGDPDLIQPDPTP